MAVLLILLSTLLFVACGPAEPNERPAATPAGPTPTLPPIAEGTGALVGRIEVADPPIEEGLSVYLASFFRHQTEGWGFYMMEPNLAPRASIDSDGFFQVLNVSPGDYVLVVGMHPEETVAVLDDSGEPMVFPVAAGETVDAGSQRVNLSAAPALNPVELTPPSGYPAPTEPAEGSYP